MAAASTAAVGGSGTTDTTDVAHKRLVEMLGVLHKEQLLIGYDGGPFEIMWDLERLAEQSSQIEADERFLASARAAKAAERHPAALASHASARPRPPLPPNWPCQ